MTRLLRTTGAIVALAAAACAEQADETTEGVEDTVAQVEEPAAEPDTTAEALWAHLQEERYTETWRTWPDKGELYEGTEPHGMLLTTYLNPVAYDALTNGAERMPDGAIVVKENYMADSTLAAVTTMYKSAGYAPDHNDWFFAKQDPEGIVEVAGRAEMCQECHGGRAANDYLFTGTLGAPDGGESGGP